MQQRVYFNGLNAMRFFAAFAVLLFHSSEWYHYQFDTPFKMFLHNLPIAVDFFFIISGFLIIYLLLVERSKNGKIDLKKFYIRRFLRIFPLYFLIILLAFLFFNTEKDIVAWDKFIYFFGNIWMITENHWTLAPLNPLWSISIEEHFYFVVPFLILITPTKFLKYLLGSIVLASLGFRIYTTLTVPNNWMSIYMHTFSQMDLLAIGGLLAWFHFKKPIRFNAPIALNILLLAAFILLLTLVDSKDYSSLYYASIKKYIFTIPLLLIIISFVFNENIKLRKLLQKKWLNYFGKISYGIYMYNAIVIHVLNQYQWLQEHYYIKIVLDTVITLLIASISFEVFEKQILKLKTKFQVVDTSGK